MAKRVSLKGKGADIFFGDYAPPGVAAPDVSVADPPVLDAPSPAMTEEEHRPSETGVLGAALQAANAPVTTTAGHDDPQLTHPTEVESESKQASKQARMRASKQSRLQASKSGTELAVIEDAEVPGDVSGSAEIAADVWACVDTPATITNSFRYTEAELSTLTDVLYEIGKQHGAKLTKQDVARLGLNVILDEYRRRGADSLLGKLAARRRQRRGGGT